MVKTHKNGREKKFGLYIYELGQECVLWGGLSASCDY